MPTLNRRVNKSDTLHPRQTEYFIKAKPPEVGYITYQIDPRAVEFLTDTLSYSDGDQLSWSLVHPLRQIKDLYTLEEGRPQNADPDTSSQRVTVPSLESEEIDALTDYLSNHPDVVGDINSFRTRLEQQDGSYASVLNRDGYTPTETPGFSSTGDETLDRIAQSIFGDETEGYITWEGDRVYDYIEVTDRERNTHQFPKIDARLPEGELLRLSRDIYERWGPEIGESEVVSRRYEPGTDGFPNRWIGQRQDSPEPSLEHAESPRAFYYRTIAGRSHYAPGEEAEEAFNEACEYSLEVYKANFPKAVDPNDLETEYVTVEKATEPWNDFQVPPGWEEKYAENGGLPPLKREQTDDLSDAQSAVVRRHSPGGSGQQWFSSTDEAIELIEHDGYRDVLIAAHNSDCEVTDFYRGGAAEPVFEIELASSNPQILINHHEYQIVFESSEGSTFTLVCENYSISEWDFPEDVTKFEAMRVIGRLSEDLQDALDFAEIVWLDM
ncbi:hypothetical protein [Halapricum hydrolyticum]|uniref:Uncharacterized protein n=1 Tax=Halapricum hydrolyticum TaxID=2979991 RepID=A0AAE3IE06_9EURY|nr:hypothetical protein [Halapricum hydrolyticum]MCU4719675.1 hypothetical protein [Halapricum hydrolyticum]MCU4728602.1 hypothetical protein [Halapricum hydrolyticum]